LIGEATVKDDDDGKDMDILEAGNDVNSGQKVKIHKC